MLNLDRKNMTVAAGLLVVAVSILLLRAGCSFSSPGAMVPGQGIIAETSGDVTLERAGKRTRPLPGDALRPGDRLATGPGSTALVEHARNSIALRERSSVTWKAIDETREGSREKIDLTVHRGSVKVTDEGTRNNPDTVTVTDEKTGRSVTTGGRRTGEKSPDTADARETAPRKLDTGPDGEKTAATEKTEARKNRHDRTGTEDAPLDTETRKPVDREKVTSTTKESAVKEGTPDRKTAAPRENSIRPLLVPEGSSGGEPVTVRKNETPEAGGGTRKSSYTAPGQVHDKADRVDYTKKPAVSLPPLR